jgi:hypothetical protein
MMMKLRSAEDTSGQQMGALSSEAHTLVDKRSEELNRRMRLIEDNVNVQTNALREEAEVLRPGAKYRQLCNLIWLHKNN